MCLKVFESIYSVFIMYSNRFANIVIGIAQSYSHYSVSSILTHLYIHFHYLQCLLFHHALPLPSFLLFPLIHFDFHKIYENITYQFFFFGASMVKWTKKWLCYAKFPKLLVKGYNIVPKCLLSWFFFMVTPIIALKFTMSKWCFFKRSPKVKS
jgi:hypothetical protein